MALLNRLCVPKWTLHLLLVLAMISVSSCLAQGKGVIVNKLPLDKNPETTRSCHSDFLEADWVDDTTILVVYHIPPCSTKSYPFERGYTMLDMQGRTIASADRNNETGKIVPGPNGGVLAIIWKRSVQTMDRNYAVLKTIDCEGVSCRVYFSADRNGFALCGVPTKEDCRYYRGRASEEAKLEDFPGGFPELEILKKRPAPAATNGQPKHYPVTDDESWFFDRKGNVFRVKAGGQAEKLPSPTATLLDSACSATVSEEGRSRLLAYCQDGVAFGDEMPVYEHERIVLYDVPSGKVLFKLDPGAGNSRESLSPDGKRIAIVRGGVFGKSSLTIYSVP